MLMRPWPYRLKKTLRDLVSLCYSHGSGAALQLTPWPCVLLPAQPRAARARDVMDFAGGGVASASNLPMTHGGAQPGGPVVLGPDLWEDMGEVAFIDALNAWGSGMHREVLSLRTDLTATQVGVSCA